MTQLEHAKPRNCPDCAVPMRVQHNGQHATIYACPKCGVTMTVPPKAPRTSAG